MEDEQISVGASDVTGKSAGQTQPEKAEVRNHVQEAYDGGDGDEIMVEIVGSDVFIDGVEGIHGSDLGMEQNEDFDAAANLFHNGDGDGTRNSVSEVGDVVSDGNRKELDESKVMPEPSEVNGGEKITEDEIMVSHEVIEGEITKEENEIEENLESNDAGGVQVAVSEVSSKLDAECPENVVEVNSLSEFSAEDVKDDKSAVSIGEKVIDAEPDDVRDMKKSDDGGSDKILEVNEDKSLRSEEQVNSGEPPITTSTGEVTNDHRDAINSGEAMGRDTSNEKVEAVDSEVSLQSLDHKGTYKAAEDGSSNVETAEDVVEANVVCNDPMVIDDAGLQDMIKENISEVSVQVTEANNVESTDLIQDDVLKTASEKEQDSASNILLSAGVHTEQPLVTDVAAYDFSNEINGYHVQQGLIYESEAMNFDHQTEEPTPETDNLQLANSKAATQTPKPSFKIGECIRRVASQLTGSTGNEKVNNDGSLNEQTERQSVAVTAESSSVDDMLLQLEQLGCNPNHKKSRGFPDPMITFFLAFRRSIHLNKRGRKRKASTAAGGAAEEFEFDDVNDSYWTDRIVQNYSEEQLMQNNNDSKLQLVPVDLEKFARRGPRPHARKRYSTGSYPSETTEEEAAKRRKQETSPAELILNFAERNCVPSEINLNKIFRRFGPIMETETEVDVDSGRARVIYKRGSDAEVAHSSAEKFNIFGPILVNYQIGYDPVISVKVSPIVVAQLQEDQTLMA